MSQSSKAANDEQVVRAIFIAPEHRGDPDWPWLTRVGALARHAWESLFIRHQFDRFPKFTRLFIARQHAAARKAIAAYDIAFTFSTDICLGIAGGMARPPADTRLVYVGFTQDGPWGQTKIDRLARAMQKYDAITVFTEAERQIYLDRYGLEGDRVHTIPIHTDEPDGYGAYPDTPPREGDYVLSMGSPNRSFKPVAQACAELKLPLVIITRPWHALDDLDEMRQLGADVITDANKLVALTYLKHARLAAMAFDDPTIPGGFTTLVHGMFMRTPFVLTYCLGMGEHVVNGETGFVTPHGDQAALSNAIDQLWSEPGLADTFGAAGHTRAETRHSLAAAASAFDRLIIA